MNDQTFQTLLSRLEPAANDPAEALAISYAAGRRDEAAAARGSLMRWRVAACVLLAATLGISAGWLTDTPHPGPVATTGETNQVEAVGVVERAGVESRPMPRPLPGSYAALRSAVLPGEGNALDRLPSDPGGPDPGPAMTVRSSI